MSQTPAGRQVQTQKCNPTIIYINAKNPEKKPIQTAYELFPSSSLAVWGSVGTLRASILLDPSVENWPNITNNLHDPNDEILTKPHYGALVHELAHMLRRHQIRRQRN